GSIHWQSERDGEANAARRRLLPRPPCQTGCEVAIAQRPPRPGTRAARRHFPRRTRSIHPPTSHLPAPRKSLAGPGLHRAGIAKAGAREGRPPSRTAAGRERAGPALLPPLPLPFRLEAAPPGTAD